MAITEYSFPRGGRSAFRVKHGATAGKPTRYRILADGTREIIALDRSEHDSAIWAKVPVAGLTYQQRAYRSQRVLTISTERAHNVQVQASKPSTAKPQAKSLPRATARSRQASSMAFLPTMDLTNK